MNQKFAEATTSTAFLLQLSKNQCNALLRLHASEGNGLHEMIVHTVSTLQCLQARGLFEWDYSTGSAKWKGITKAGHMVAELLLEAGLTIENTNSVSVLRRVA